PVPRQGRRKARRGPGRGPGGRAGSTAPPLVQGRMIVIVLVFVFVFVRRGAAAGSGSRAASGRNMRIVPRGCGRRGCGPAFAGSLGSRSGIASVPGRGPPALGRMVRHDREDALVRFVGAGRSPTRGRMGSAVVAPFMVSAVV